jgi:DNA-binding MarR family transcriptional regulator
MKQPNFLRFDIPKYMETAENFNVNTSFGLLVGRTAKLLVEHLQQRLNTPDIGLTMSHWIILAQLWHEDGLSQQEISNRSGVAKPNVTTMVDTLEKESFIVRIPDQIDRRINRIFLTQKAKNIRCKAIEQALSVYQTAFEGFTAKEREALLQGLQKVRTNLQSGAEGSCGHHNTSE